MSVLSLFAKAQRLEEAEDYELAVIEYRKALSVNAEFKPAHERLAAIADTCREKATPSGDGQAAVRYARIVRELRPDDAESFRCLGWALLQAQQLEEAESVLSELLATGLDDFGSLFLLANVKNAQGDSRAAASLVYRLLKTAPDVFNVYRNFVFFSGRLMLEQAKRHVARATPSTAA
jgi:tetratricopeptide (TPR) repeat protein